MSALLWIQHELFLEKSGVRLKTVTVGVITQRHSTLLLFLTGPYHNMCLGMLHVFSSFWHKIQESSVSHSGCNKCS